MDLSPLWGCVGSLNCFSMYMSSRELGKPDFIKGRLCTHVGLLRAGTSEESVRTREPSVTGVPDLGYGVF